MSNQSVIGGEGREAEGALARIVAFARRGQAEYLRRAASLRRWLRPQAGPDEGADLSSLGTNRSLRGIFAARHLRERQRAYREAGGKRASVALQAIQRISELHDGQEE